MSELQRRVADAAGWLHAGRARREALTIGWLLHLRVAPAAVRRDLAASSLRAPRRPSASATPTT